MKYKNHYWVLLLFALLSSTGCEKFLNVEPVEKLSGNNFWESQKDVEAFTLDLYRLFRAATTNNIVLIQADYRCAPAKQSEDQFPVRYDFGYMAENDLLRTIAARADRDQSGYDPYREWYQLRSRYDLIPDWTPFYKVVQSANILVEEISNVDDPSFSEAARNKYIAEAVFLRSLSYFFMVRLYGDVPYYTNAYNQEPLPRMDMVEVLNNCMLDLDKVKENLPWTYEDPANRAVRAMQGSAIALLMHMNMWCAGFDEANKDIYYNAVDNLGTFLYQEGEIAQGAYSLLPMSKSHQVFAGRSKEGLFEVPQNYNYGESIAEQRLHFSNAVLHEPYLAGREASELVYYIEYMQTIYPEEQPDLRKDIWFDEFIYDETGKFQCYKYFSIYAGETEIEKASADNFMIFRYAGAILLQAEALAELGEDARATQLLNRIRGRAEAALFPANPGEGNLKDAIFWERCREMMGEGHYFYDLVRTKRILNSDFCWNPLSYSDFIQGAWTWPIAVKALNNNPYMTLNDYWQ